MSYLGLVKGPLCILLGCLVFCCELADGELMLSLQMLKDLLRRSQRILLSPLCQRCLLCHLLLQALAAALPLGNVAPQLCICFLPSQMLSTIIILWLGWMVLKSKDGHMPREL